jgi:hypothetical protein
VEKRRNYEQALQNAAPPSSLLENTRPVAVRREQTTDALDSDLLAEPTIPYHESEIEPNLLNTITAATISANINHMHSTPLNPFKRPVNVFDGLYGTPIDERSPQYKLAKTSLTTGITRNIQATNSKTNVISASTQKPREGLVNMSYMSDSVMSELNDATDKRQSIIHDTFEEDPYEAVPIDSQLAEDTTFTTRNTPSSSSLTNRQSKERQALFSSPNHNTPEKLRYLIGASSTTPRSAPSRDLTHTPTPNRSNIWRTKLTAQQTRDEEHLTGSARRLPYQDILRDNRNEPPSSMHRLSRVLDNAPPSPEADPMFNDDYAYNITDISPYDREILELAAKQRHEEKRRHTLNENEIYGIRHQHQQPLRRNRVFSTNTASATTPNPFNSQQNQEDWPLGSHQHQPRDSKRNVSDQSLGTSMLRSRISHTTDGSPQPAIIKDVVGARVRQGVCYT